jgi:hypothetical protein
VEAMGGEFGNLVLACLLECLLDFSVFDRRQSLGVADQGHCKLDSVKSIGFSESKNWLEIQVEIEK